MDRPPLRFFWDKYGQSLFNIYLFISFGIWCIWSVYQSWSRGNLTFLELSFVIPNFILAALFLLRKPHKAICISVFDQVISLVAFCSGMALSGAKTTGGKTAVLISEGVIIVANILGVATLLNLGKSFGILIAFRDLKQSGLYGIIRHPMYFTDILLRVGYVISHTDPYSVIVVIGSSACYVSRAILEERFLFRQPEYADYMTRVRYRFLPGIF